MEVEKKRTLFFGGLLIFIVGFFITYYLWANFIDRGTVSFVGKTPFLVDVYKNNTVAETVDCQSSPCKIKTRSMETNFIVKKDSYLSELFTLDVPLWRTVEQIVSLNLIPGIDEVDSIPQVNSPSQYEVIKDPATQSYKLINSDDINRRAIVYFQKEIKNPKIFSSPNAVLIVDQSADYFLAYLVNTELKTRKQISSTEISTLQNGVFSYDGTYLAFDTRDSDTVYLVDPAQNITPLTLTTDVRQTAWTPDNSLIFVTLQLFENNKLTETLGDIYTVGLYNPETNSYIKVASLPAGTATPKNFIPLSNGREVYFEAGQKIFKITLK